MRQMYDHRFELRQGNTEFEGAAKMDSLFALAAERDQRRNGDERALFEFETGPVPDVTEEMFDCGRRQIFG